MLLEGLGTPLDKVVQIEVSRDLLEERATLRRTDKRTGHIYHLKYSLPPPGAELEQRADDHEETVTESALAAHEGHAAIKEMGRKFSSRAGPAKAGNFFAWMQDGATAEEQSALKASVPGPVLAILAGLFGRRYRKEIAPVWATSSSF